MRQTIGAQARLRSIPPWAAEPLAAENDEVVREEDNAKAMNAFALFKPGRATEVIAAPARVPQDSRSDRFLLPDRTRSDKK